MHFLILFFLELVLLYFLAKRLTASVYGFFLRLTKNRIRASYLLAVLFLPGTFVHEVSHALAALFLLVPFGEVEFLPQTQGDAIRMGSVGIGKTDPVRRFLIGIAPFIFGTSLILGGLYFLTLKSVPINLYFILLTAYLIFAIGNTMFASKKDLEGALQLFLFILLIYLLFFVLGIRFPFFNLKTLFTIELVEVLKISNIFLLIPLGLDTLIIITFKILKL